MAQEGEISFRLGFATTCCLILNLSSSLGLSFPRYKPVRSLDSPASNSQHKTLFRG